MCTTKYYKINGEIKMEMYFQDLTNRKMTIDFDDYHGLLLENDDVILFSDNREELIFGGGVVCVRKMEQSYFFCFDEVKEYYFEIHGEKVKKILKNIQISLQEL